MLKIQGIPKNIRTSLIGIATRKDISLFERRSYIALTKDQHFGYLAYINGKTKKKTFIFPCISVDNDDIIGCIHEGDILQIKNDGLIKCLWRKGSNSNCLFVTSSCNCKCLMCPQPPSNDHDNFRKINMTILSYLDPSDDEPVCLTGGEPTLRRKDFLEYLKILKENYNNRRVDILTNGQNFSDIDFAYTVAKACPDKTSFCVSLHADTQELHDKIVGAVGSFKKTLYGIQNLGRLGLPVEIRFVISKQNYFRTKEFADFIVHNFPFVYHVALMGLEIVGLARNNFDDIWVDPVNCNIFLLKAVKVFNRANISSSIYNIPLCLLEKQLWAYSKQSISDWKNSYRNICNSCSVKSQCCGLFSTSSFISQNLHPLT